MFSFGGKINIVDEKMFEFRCTLIFPQGNTQRPTVTLKALRAVGTIFIYENPAKAEFHPIRSLR